MNKSDLKSLAEKWWDKAIGIDPGSTDVLHQCSYELERLLDRFPFCDKGHPLPIEYWGKDCPICDDLRAEEKVRKRNEELGIENCTCYKNNTLAWEKCPVHGKGA